MDIDTNYDKYSGYSEGWDEIECPCGNIFYVAWVDEYGMKEWVEAPICPDCGEEYEEE